MLSSKSTFFKLFPPPVFMLMPHSGLDISEESMHCIGYKGFGHNRRISLYGREDLPPGLFEGGEIKDEKEFVSRLSAFGKKFGLSQVKVSVPEEKAYLFQTDVPSTEESAMEQNIEFKLEENVPLSATDAVFYFDLVPRRVTGGALRASVSVVPRTYIEHYMSLVEKAGLSPISFETVPKAIARSVVPFHSDRTLLIIHSMPKKTGIYVVSGNVVNFAVTTTLDDLTKEISRVRSYWLSHGNGKDIDEAILVGKNATDLEAACRGADGEKSLEVRIADVWCNAIDIDKYLPPVSKTESLEYAIAAGLAFESVRSL